jgi:hypothetical protein
VVILLLTASLLTPRFATDLFTDDSTAITTFRNYYQGAYRWPITIASASATVK